MIAVEKAFRFIDPRAAKNSIFSIKVDFQPMKKPKISNYEKVDISN
jgi:hypothetical protein